MAAHQSFRVGPCPAVGVPGPESALSGVPFEAAVGGVCRGDGHALRLGQVAVRGGGGSGAPLAVSRSAPALRSRPRCCPSGCSRQLGWRQFSRVARQTHSRPRSLAGVPVPVLSLPLPAQPPEGLPKSSSEGMPRASYGGSGLLARTASDSPPARPPEGPSRRRATGDGDAGVQVRGKRHRVLPAELGVGEPAAGWWPPSPPPASPILRRPTARPKRQPRLCRAGIRRAAIWRQFVVRQCRPDAGAGPADGKGVLRRPLHDRSLVLGGGAFSGVPPRGIRYGRRDMGGERLRG